MTVVVLGAGLAGLVTAYELAGRGLPVTVVEAAPFAGGRTSSWTDRDGRPHDTGLHVVADHYVGLIEILSTLGVSRRLRWVKEHALLRPGRPPVPWSLGPRRPPLHLLRAARTAPLSLRERLRLLPALVEAARLGQAELAALDGLTYLEWHRARRLGDGFALELAEAGADAATFLSASEASARAVLSWTKYMLRDRHAADVGMWTGSLAECLVEPLVRAITARGGTVRTGWAAVDLELAGSGVRAVRLARSQEPGAFTRASGRPAVDGAGELLPCDVLVSALPVQALRALLGHRARDAGLASIEALRTVPAISVVLEYDRAFAAPPGAPLVAGATMRDLVDLATLDRQPAGCAGSAHEVVVCRASEWMARTDECCVA